MKEITRTKKIFITCIALNVIIFGAYGFLLWGIYSKADKVAVLVAEAAKDIKNDENLRVVKASLLENQEFITHIDEFFVPADGVVDFITELEQLGNESGVVLTIGGVAIEESATQQAKEILSVTLATEGSWAHTFYFLSLLENLPYQIELSSATAVLSGASESILFSGSGRVRASDEIWKGTFEIHVYKLQ